MIKKKLAVLLASILTISALAAPASVMADSTTSGSTSSGTSKSGVVVSLGADLSDSEKATVLKLLGVTETELAQDTTITVTNADEHSYLDSYLDSSVIGTRALSSCRVEKAKDGAGITVETHNINYCTPSMYENALSTAGLKNADIVVAGPFNISGTAALVGAMKAYEAITGDVIQPELVDGATDELVTTSKVADDVGDSDKVTQLIAAVKEIVINNNYSSDSDIGKAVDDVTKQLNITLSDEDRQLIIDLMKKLGTLDIDVNSLKEQAQNIYNQIKNGSLDLSQYGITKEQTNSFLAMIQEFFNNIGKWFSSLFGNSN